MKSTKALYAQYVVGLCAMVSATCMRTFEESKESEKGRGSTDAGLLLRGISNLENLIL